MNLYAWIVALAIAAGGGFVAGQRLKQGEWDAAQLEQRRQAAGDDLRRADRAQTASTEFEAYKAAAAARLRQTHDALAIALRSPISCPPPGEPALELGDVVLPAAVLDGVRSAAGVDLDAAPAAGEPGAGLRPRPAAAGR